MLPSALKPPLDHYRICQLRPLAESSVKTLTDTVDIIVETVTKGKQRIGTMSTVNGKSHELILHMSPRASFGKLPHQFQEKAHGARPVC
jgi:hypothetical protein